MKRRKRIRNAKAAAAINGTHDSALATEDGIRALLVFILGGKSSAECVAFLFVLFRRGPSITAYELPCLSGNLAVDTLVASGG